MKTYKEFKEGILDDIIADFDQDTSAYKKTPSWGSPASKEIKIKSGMTAYHGTNDNITRFTIQNKRANRGTNTTGIYFIPYKWEAGEYGKNVYEAKITWKKAWYTNRKMNVNDAMIAKARELLLKYTNYRENWLDTAILPAFKKEKQFTAEFGDINGDIKREILLAGGYDCQIDGREICILNPKQIRMIGKLSEENTQGDVGTKKLANNRKRMTPGEKIDKDRKTSN